MKAQLTITLEDNGAISVNGPIGDKLVSYGLLEAARDAIQSHHARIALQQAVDRGNGGRILVPQLQVPRDLKGA